MQHAKLSSDKTRLLFLQTVQSVLQQRGVQSIKHTGITEQLKELQCVSVSVSLAAVVYEKSN